MTGEDNLGADGGNIDDSGPDKAGGAQLGPPACTLTDAVMALMDTPHPLDILGEPGSYGFQVGLSGIAEPLLPMGLLCILNCLALASHAQKGICPAHLRSETGR